METFNNFLYKLIDEFNIFVDIGDRLFPLYILAMIAIGYVLYKRSDTKKPFLTWLFPWKMYSHKSSITDLKLFIFGRLFSALGIFNVIFVTTATAAIIIELINGKVAEDTNLHPVFIGFLILLANDFGVYWTHRIHHETTILWPFHSVHHSAEVLTPLTVYRKHPVYDFISQIIKSLFKGLLIGVLLGLFVGKIEYITLVGTTSFYVIFNLVGSNFRHSHIWLSYGRVMEHIFISPAQHQIHHSVAKEHWNKNYGEVFAIWDWMFGTLYVPKKMEILKFGISGELGAEQPHKTLTDALLVPAKQSWKALKSKKANHKPKPIEEVTNE